MPFPFLIALALSSESGLDKRCKLCKNISASFAVGLKTTDTIEFTGESKGWSMDNEKFYGKYKMTGARFEEILESLCGLAEGSDSKVDGRNVPSSFSLGFGAGDAAMAAPKDISCLEELEKLEDGLEEWWKSKDGSKDEKDYGDLEQALCFEAEKLCCPPSTYGPECTSCPIVEGELCSGRGTCNGDGSRGGTGKCKCKKGFSSTSGCSVCKGGLTLVPGLGRTAKCIKGDEL